MCGKLGYPALTEATIYAKGCPAGTKLCSGATEPGKSLCIDESKPLTDCPIVSLKLVSTDDQSSDLDWTTVDFSVGGYALAFSRTCCDSLPVGSLRLEAKPCYDPSKVSTTATKLGWTFKHPYFEMVGEMYGLSAMDAKHEIPLYDGFYPFEREWIHTGCGDDGTDKRYNQLSAIGPDGRTLTPWQVTEYDVQEQSGVLEIISSMPLAAEEVDLD